MHQRIAVSSSQNMYFLQVIIIKKWAISALGFPKINSRKTLCFWGNNGLPSPSHRIDAARRGYRSFAGEDQPSPNTRVKIVSTCLV